MYDKYELRRKNNFNIFFKNYCSEKFLKFYLSLESENIESNLNDIDKDIYLSMNSMIIWETIIKYTEINWNFKYLSLNPNITWDNVISTLDRDWSFDLLSKHPNITWNIIKQNLDKPWNSYIVIDNPNITLDIILQNPTFFNIQEIIKFQEPDMIEINDSNIVNKLSNNPNITWEIVCKYPKIDWNYYILSSNKNITWDIVVNNLDKKWCFNKLSENINITYNIMKNNKHFEWNLDNFFKNDNFTWKIYRDNSEELQKIFKNFKKSRILYDFSKNINIDENIILNTDNDEWCNYSLLSNQNMSFDFIRNNYSNIKKISGVRNSKWSICKNKFIVQKKIFKEECAKIWLSAFKIQNMSRSGLYNPNYLIFKKIFINRFKDIKNNINIYNYF